MKRRKELRNKTLAVYVTATELAALKEEFKSTTHRVFAEFIRARLREEPLVRKTRNQSLDNLHHGLIGIKAELETARRSFTEAVNRFKSLSPDLVDQQCLEFLLAEEIDLRETIKAVQSTLIQLYERCSQEQSPLQK